MQLTDRITLDVTFQEALGIVQLVSKVPIDQGLGLFQELQKQLDPHIQAYNDVLAAAESQTANDEGVVPNAGSGE